jgi:hypothetical protein
MFPHRHTLIVLAALVIGAFVSGCASDTTTENNTIPWTRPADWQGGIPGMSNAFGGNTGGGNALH